MPIVLRVCASNYETDYYALFGELIHVFEKCEKKKLLANKFNELILKPVLDFVSMSVKVFMKPLSFCKGQE